MDERFEIVGVDGAASLRVTHVSHRRGVLARYLPLPVIPVLVEALGAVVRRDSVRTGPVLALRVQMRPLVCRWEGDNVRLL